MIRDAAAMELARDILPKHSEELTIQLVASMIRERVKQEELEQEVEQREKVSA